MKAGQRGTILIASLRNSPSFKLIRSGYECRSSDINLGTKKSVTDCYNAVKAKGGKFFIFGIRGSQGNKSGRCYLERTSASSCKEGWERDSYNFYAISTAPVAVRDLVKQCPGDKFYMSCNPRSYYIKFDYRTAIVSAYAPKL